MLREDARVPIQHLWANDAIQEVQMLRRFAFINLNGFAVLSNTVCGT